MEKAGRAKVTGGLFVLSAILAGLSAIRCPLSAILLIYQRFAVPYQRS
ncbi:hypothetical protein ACIQ57_18005 [Lysinibacillus xylanilyticus]